MPQEREYNPFMRTHEPYVMKSLGVKDPVAAMSKLREAKNNYRYAIVLLYSIICQASPRIAICATQRCIDGCV